MRRVANLRVPSKPRVLQVITHLSLGGAERVCFTLMEGLEREVDFSVFAVRGVTDGAIGQKLESDCRRMGIPLYRGSRLPLKTGGLFASGVALASTIASARPDIVHLHTEAPEAAFAIAAALRPQLARAPLLVRTIHNSVYWSPWRKVGVWSERRMRASYVIGVSRAAVKAFMDVRDESGAGPLPAPPDVVFNGVDLRAAPGRPRPFAQDGIIRVLFAGRFEFQKGVDMLPEVLAAAPPPDGFRCELNACGQGRMSDVLYRLQAHPPRGWSVNLMNPVPDIAPLLRAADLVIMPSRFEGFGLIAVESLWAGVPVISTDSPGLHEVFPPDYPWLSDQIDAESFGAVLKRALRSPDVLAQSVRDAQPYLASRFDSKIMCEGYRQIYTDLWSKRTPATCTAVVG